MHSATRPRDDVAAGAATPPARRRPRWAAAGRLVALAAAAWAPAPAAAAGIEIPELGAWASGRGGAVAAQPTSGLALHFNPAALAFGRGLELGLDGKALWQTVSFQPSDPRFLVAGGHLAENTALPYLGPTNATLVYARRFHDKLATWAVGLGAIGPSAAGRVAYPADGPQRYDKIGVDAFLALYSAGAALRLGPLAVGGTLQLARGSIELSQAVASPLKFPAYPDILSDLSASLGWSATGVVGVSANLGRHLALGLSWRPAFRLGGAGTLAVTLPPSLASLATVHGDRAHLGINFPHVVRLGLLWRPLRGLQVEVDGVYEGWSALQAIEVVPDDITLKPVVLAAVPLAPITLQKHWHDIVGARVGAEMTFLHGRLVARAGYLFEPSAIPAAYAGVDFPNFGTQAISLGGSVRLFGALLDVAVVQHLRPEVAVAGGQARAVSAPALPLLGAGTSGNTPINNGLFTGGVTAVAVGLRVPFGRLRRAL